MSKTNFIVRPSKVAIYSTTLLAGLFFIGVPIFIYFSDINNKGDLYIILPISIIFGVWGCLRMIRISQEKILIHIDEKGVFDARTLKLKIPWENINEIIVENDYMKTPSSINRVDNKVTFYGSDFKKYRRDGLYLGSADKLEVSPNETGFDVEEMCRVINLYKPVKDMSTPKPPKRPSFS